MLQVSGCRERLVRTWSCQGSGARPQRPQQQGSPALRSQREKSGRREGSSTASLEIWESGEEEAPEERKPAPCQGRQKGTGQQGPRPSPETPVSESRRRSALCSDLAAPRSSALMICSRDKLAGSTGRRRSPASTRATRRGHSLRAGAYRGLSRSASMVDITQMNPDI